MTMNVWIPKQGKKETRYKVSYFINKFSENKYEKINYDINENKLNPIIENNF